MLTASFAKALRNLLLPGIFKLFLLCLLAYAAGWIALSWALSALIGAYIGLTGAEGVMVHLLSGAGSMVAAWFLFPLLYPILVSCFDDRMAAVIEREDYPQLPAAQPPFWPTALSDALFSFKAIALNIFCLPLYLIPLLGIALYYGLNGYLLGAQFFRMAAGRRVSPAEAAAMQKRARGSILLAGVAISFCATIPLVNLAAPFAGAATMLHFFHRLRNA